MARIPLYHDTAPLYAEPGTSSSTSLRQPCPVRLPHRPLPCLSPRSDLRHRPVHCHILSYSGLRISLPRTCGRTCTDRQCLLCCFLPPALPRISDLRYIRHRHRSRLPRCRCQRSLPEQEVRVPSFPVRRLLLESLELLLCLCPVLRIRSHFPVEFDGLFLVPCLLVEDCDGESVCVHVLCLRH